MHTSDETAHNESKTQKDRLPEKETSREAAIWSRPQEHKAERGKKERRPEENRIAPAKDFAQRHVRFPFGKLCLRRRGWERSIGEIAGLQPPFARLHGSQQEYVHVRVHFNGHALILGYHRPLRGKLPTLQCLKRAEEGMADPNDLPLRIESHGRHFHMLVVHVAFVGKQSLHFRKSRVAGLHPRCPIHRHERRGCEALTNKGPLRYGNLHGDGDIACGDFFVKCRHVLLPPWEEKRPPAHGLPDRPIGPHLKFVVHAGGTRVRVRIAQEADEIGAVRRGGQRLYRHNFDGTALARRGRRTGRRLTTEKCHKAPKADPKPEEDGRDDDLLLCAMTHSVQGTVDRRETEDARRPGGVPSALVSLVLHANVGYRRTHAMPEFTHLHVHSHYSLLDGLGKIPDLLDCAQELGMRHLAITDHGALYGLVEFWQEAKERNIHPILGIEAYLAPEGRTNKRARIDDKPRHLTLLARNIQGYQNLLKLSTAAYLEGFYYKPRIDYDILRQFSEGLIVLSGCLNGDIPQAIQAGQRERAEERIRWHLETFGRERFFLELQHHPTLSEQRVVNEALLRYARQYGVPVVATGDVHYVHERDAEAQDVLVCVQTGNVVTDKDRLCMLGENYALQPAVQLAEQFRDHPEAIENSMRIAEMCSVDLPLGTTVLPRFPLPEGQSAEQALRELSEHGLSRRYHTQVPETVRERLAYELSVIEKTGFASYFLIVQDFVNWAKHQGILVGPGRGSAAGSIVSYLLNITDMDPVRYDLMFERFLNPARVTMPDIDLDFADDRRDEVIAYVREKYGRDHVAQIITFGTMAARASIRDAGRALGFPYTFCDKVAKLIPLHATLEDAAKTVPELQELIRADPQAQRLLDTAKRLEGVARHASTHAAGVVITDAPLTEYVPLQRASADDSTMMTQYAMTDIEALGLLKIDFLGLKNLTILQNCLRSIRERQGVTMDLAQMPLDDAATYVLLQKANTTGVFQLESSGIKRVLRELKPTEFEDIIAIVALYRPGPMDLIPEYIAGKHGRKSPTYVHPTLEPILRKTHGIAVYQEQIMQIARDLAGFSLGEADLLRKAMGKKIPKLLMEQKTKFIEGAVRNGVTQVTAEHVFAFIEPFAGYGFNRAHAACYALIAYQTAYLKTHQPAAFMAALLTSDESDTDRIAIEVAECQAMGLPVLPPDVNQSDEHFTVVRGIEDHAPKRGGSVHPAEGMRGDDIEPHAIRFGLRAIKNVGNNVVDVILAARRSGGPFADLVSFFTRVQTKDLNKKSVESLAKAGAFDSLAERNLILENLDTLLASNRDAVKRAQSNQADLFGGSAQHEVLRPALRLKHVEPAPSRQKLRWEKELLGLFVSGHPLAEIAEILARSVTPAIEITTNLGNVSVRVGGMITRIQRIMTRSQKAMAFVTLEDRSGSLEILVFPKILEATADLWVEDRVVIVEGRVSDKDGTPKILADRAAEFNPLEPPPPLSLDARLHASPPARVVVRVPRSAPRRVFGTLKTIFTSAEKGPTSILLKIPREDGAFDLLKTSYAIIISPGIRGRIESLLGPGTVTNGDQDREAQTVVASTGNRETADGNTPAHKSA